MRQRRASAPSGRMKSPLGNLSNRTIQRRSNEMADLFKENISGLFFIFLLFCNLILVIGTPQSRTQKKTLLKNVCSKVLTPSPQKHDHKMTAQEDLGVTLLTGMSFKQRRRLKKFLGSRDPFASTRSFEAEKKKFGNLTKYQWSQNEDCIFCSNIKEVIKFFK